jgi:hypothetical protein
MADAETAESKFKTIWKAADVQIKSSCMCQPGV